MKRSIILMVAALGIPWLVFAHGADRAQGQQLAKDLQDGTVQCATLDETKFENMGDNYMEQMMGSTHETMDNLMEKMMGEEGLSQMHMAMGKRMSGCDTNVQMPAGMMSGMMNMMGGGAMMGGGGMMDAQNVGKTQSAMMRSEDPSRFTILWYVVVVLGAVALVLVIIKYLRELLK